MYSQIPEAQRPSTWHRSWFECCGDCDDEGCGICCLSSSLPYVAIGWNKKRAFSASGIKWGFIILILFCVPSVPHLLNQVASQFNVDVAINPRIVAMVGGVCTLFIIMYITLGLINRIQMRTKFKLPGSCPTDFMLWTFCSPCALCQETRTLTYNNVKDGVWHGPETMVAPSKVPPNTQAMV